MVENVTAPSAGGFPGPDGEVRLRMRLPFRTGSSSRSRHIGPTPPLIQQSHRTDTAATHRTEGLGGPHGVKCRRWGFPLKRGVFPKPGLDSSMGSAG
ncbi:MAG: hypothetical protein ACOX52_24095 [Verrucomicrobiota bacterium]